MAQHRSQMPRFAPRLLALLPASVFALVAGREWFVDPAAAQMTQWRRDLFDR